MSSVAIDHARASSPRETRINAKLAAAITPSPIPSRAKRNGTFSHAAFCGIGCVTHGKIRLRPKYNPKNRKNPTHRKWRERLAETIRRRTAPLGLRQVERRGRDHRALRDAKEEQQIDEIGLPCDRGAAAQSARTRTRSRRSRSSRPRPLASSCRRPTRLLAASRRVLAMRCLRLVLMGLAPPVGRLHARPLRRPIPSSSTRRAPLPPRRIEPRSRIDLRRSARRIPAQLSVAGIPESPSTPKKPKIPPSRTISSKQIMMNGGHDSSGLPPALRRHS